ncbi:glutathione S-transferase family protein [Rivularia sp. UHCC 0363]|uniref:glutathione S-transferase family protein n=1 Tax=Rivularia sp. UHCC 0363 TaxID=3110244 RepID=UPI002B21ED1E|nr:glutathione S-transferase family protein [Rivularia sp. UHCC 0363]MEA5594515.1 glutathione S-transferase family protein [Rivularia sp. UHCC 0363]
MPNLTLYGTPQSTYVRTVRLLLAEANIDYDLKDIGIFNGENNTDEYLAKHPFGKVPTMEIDGKQIYETAAITYYINEKMAGSKYSPSDILTQARMLQIMAIIDNYLYAPAVGTIVIQNLIVPSQGGQTDKEAVKEAVAPTQKALKAIEDLFIGSPFLVDSLISIADFYLIPIFVYLAQTPEFDAVTAQTPKLKAWWEQTKNLASVKNVCA